jgi:hypothetical protein
MDLITHPPVTKTGNDAIIVFVDKLTKMARLAATKTTVSAEGFTQIFVDNVFKSHGLPSKIVSDRDSRFTGHFMKALTKSLGIRQAMSTSFHPQTDGQTERMNRVLEDMLRHYVNPYQNDWDEYLTVVEFAINNAFQTSIQNTPFFLNYGQHPMTPLTLQVDQQVRVPGAVKFLNANIEAIRHAKTCLLAAQDRQKAYADKTRRDVKDIRVGDMVLLHTRNLKFKNQKAADVTPKFLPKWVGPFPVTKLIGPQDDKGSVRLTTAVQLELPPMMKIHDVFHLDLIKPYKSDGFVHPPAPLLYEEDGTPQWEVESLVATRIRKKVDGRPQVTEYLVRWAGFGAEHDTWEPSANIHKDLVSSFLGDQAAQPKRAKSTRKRKGTES